MGSWGVSPCPVGDFQGKSVGAWDAQASLGGQFYMQQTASAPQGGQIRMPCAEGMPGQFDQQSQYGNSCEQQQGGLQGQCMQKLEYLRRLQEQVQEAQQQL